MGSFSWKLAKGSNTYGQDSMYEGHPVSFKYAVEKEGNKGMRITADNREIFTVLFEENGINSIWVNDPYSQNSKILFHYLNSLGSFNVVDAPNLGWIAFAHGGTVDYLTNLFESCEE